ncbi:MAG TPA: TlpA disulfide reductase family protein [Burkholderiales bacterium]|nr:TlpA disulfide reductase family protein [Burkholderiales bacterium]
MSLLFGLNPSSMGRLRNRMLLVVLAATVFASCAPAFEKKAAPVVTFLTIKGEKIAVSELRGKVVLVNFWATDCPICLKEMPQLIETHRKFQARGFETVAVAMWYDPPNRVISYAEQRALPFKVAFDPVGEHAKAFGDLMQTPTTFVIDKRGNIVSRIVGEPDFGKLHALIEEKLSEKI